MSFRLKKVQEKKKKIKAKEEAEKREREEAGKAEEAPSIFDDFRDPEILFD